MQTWHPTRRRWRAAAGLIATRSSFRSFVPNEVKRGNVHPMNETPANDGTPRVDNRFVLASVSAALFLLVIAMPAAAQVNLGTAGSFGVLAGSTVTNTGT